MPLRVSLEEANVSLGLQALSQQTAAEAAAVAGGGAGAAPPLLSALHPNRRLLALARGPVLSFLPVHPDPDGADAAAAAADGEGAGPVTRGARRRASGAASAASAAAAPSPPRRPAAAPCYTLRTSQGITSLAWLAVLAGSRQLGAASLTVRPPELSELLECECLLVGMQDGTLQIHSAAGRLLFKQRMHAGPLEHIAVRACSTGVRYDDPSEDVAFVFPDAFVRLPVLELRTHLKLLELSAQSTGAGAGAPPLSFHRWELPSGVGPRSSAVCLGPRPRDLDAVLLAAARTGGRPGDQKLLVVTGGTKPPLAAFEIEEQPQRSTLARLKGYAGSVTTAAVGAASKAATLGPSLLGQGVRSLANWVAGPSLDAMRGAAVPAYDLTSAPKPEAALPWRALRDDARSLAPLAPAPAGALLAAADNLGRVLLVDGASMVVLRMWKGYRDAQCGWALPRAPHPWARHGLLLAIYAPRRQLLELWAPRQGVRVAAARLEGACHLLRVGPPCGGWQNELGERWRERGGPGTLVLRLGGGRERGAVVDVIEACGGSGGGGGGGGGGGAAGARTGADAAAVGAVR
ncbi:rab3 GTPase-activating non-catalytic subunit [Raphidocelis subcapitata]|uniref:Rab3 GTPase-activating non-catalytic subunit n=1 Tax=Raphidocelis subcapitata TaxID=307507 RepID=A0A2V0NLH5_9CHLO|nr:rab3 GTPase-activating non-catalytic subunit [Raphidocelis subcapitata]|eukprot:GBF88261.1 rab3 GTPase-activating non-catalytic subunit [Raphidocelis subcapitata]